MDETEASSRWEVSSLRARAYLQDNFSLTHDSLEDNKLYNYPKGGRKASYDKSLFFLMMHTVSSPRMHVRVIDKWHDSMSHFLKTVDGQTKISISLVSVLSPQWREPLNTVVQITKMTQSLGPEQLCLLLEQTLSPVADLRKNGALKQSRKWRMKINLTFYDFCIPTFIYISNFVLHCSISVFF